MPRQGYEDEDASDGSKYREEGKRRVHHDGQGTYEREGERAACAMTRQDSCIVLGLRSIKRQKERTMDLSRVRELALSAREVAACVRAPLRASISSANKDTLAVPTLCTKRTQSSTTFCNLFHNLHVSP